MRKLSTLFLIILVSHRILAQPIDPLATEETKNLFYNLQTVAKGNLLFGHEDALAYGLNEDHTRWIDEDNRSDVRSVTGSHPAVYGWDLGRLEVPDSTANIDDVDFERMKYWIISGYERGGIITISWHSNNPQTGGDTWDTSGNAPSHILPGGDKHDFYKGWLDKVADFALSLTDSEGKLVPVLFRPYHEHTGGWFWWGKNSCTPEEYKALWIFTVEYLRDTKGVHNFLYSYSPSNSGVNNSTDYLNRYPGDNYVDMLGTDDYGNIYNANQEFNFLKNLKIAINLANERGKIAALTETGYEKIPDADWFSTRIVGPIMNDEITRQLAYFLVWRNGRPDHYYAPYPGHSAAPDLIKIHEDPFMQFEDGLIDMYGSPEISISKQLEDLELTADSEDLIQIDLDEYFTGADSYQIAYQSDNSLIDLILNNNLLTIASTSNFGDGLYRISAHSNNQIRELMFLVDVEEPEIPTSIVEDDRSITIYPNPATDFIKVNSDEPLQNYVISDQMGRIKKGIGMESKIDIRNLTPGLYQLSLTYKSKVVVKRFVKQ
jgi:mannan endo-1,4-beta-mannosidase